MAVYKITVPAIFYSNGSNEMESLEKIVTREKPLELEFEKAEFEQIESGVANEGSRITWAELLPLLGIVPDNYLANLAGVNKKAITQKRVALGIPTSGR